MISETNNMDLATPSNLSFDLESIIQLAADTASQLSTLYDLDELAETTVRLLQQRLGYDRVSLSLMGVPDPGSIQAYEAAASHPRILRRRAADNNTSLAYRAARGNSIIVAGDLDNDPANGSQPHDPDQKSQINIPLVRENRVLGVLSLGSAQPHVFDDEQIATALRFLAAQLAAAINRAHRFSRKFEPATEPPVKDKIFSHVVDMHHIVPEAQPLGGGIRKVFDKIVRGVVEGLGYTGAVLAVVNEEDKTLLVQAIAYSNFTDRKNWNAIENRFGVRIIGGIVSLEHDQSNLAVQSCVSGKTKFTHDLYDLFRPLVNEKIAGYIQTNTRIKSSLAIPLTANKTVVGALCAGTEKEEISPADLDALYYFATNAAIAIQNSLHIDQVRRDLAMREAELSQLRRIERMIHSSLDAERVLKHILNGAIELTGADYGQVVLVGKYASGLLRRVCFPDSLDVTSVEPPGLSELMASRPLPDLAVVSELIKRNNTYCPSKAGRMPNGNQPPRSMLGVTISLDEELVGAINIASNRIDAFSDRALDMLEQIGVQAAIAIRNAYHFKTEQEIRERLVNVSQVVAMGDMAGNMVHSINNWVGAIRSDLNILLRAQDRGDEPSADELREMYNDILANAEATLAMAENIKKPFQSLEQEPVDVNQCISQVLRDKRAEMPNVIVIEDYSPVPRVMATRQLELVFENLINNSLQAMKQLVCGLLRCTTRLSQDGQWVEITVQDTGPGLPEHLNPTDIFKLGVSGRKNGMGYGLWWTDTFLKRWGGHIDFIEHTKRGCEFLVRLPVLNETSM